MTSSKTSRQENIMADCEKRVPRKNVSKKTGVSQENCELQKPVRCSEYETVGDRPRTSQLGSERCLLCNCEQFDNFHNDHLDKAHSSSILPKVPLWVCPTCRKCVEEQERRATLETSPLPSLNLTLSLSTCGCQKSTNCKNHNHPEKGCTSEYVNLEKDQHQFQLLWSEVCNFVRCVYREAGTSLADGEETVRNSLDEERFKAKVDRLLAIDPRQLFEKLECQAREYVSEVKSRLISFLNSCPLSPQHAREFFSMFLDEYQALCCAAEVLRPFFVKLENPILKHFNLSWTSLHKHLFYNEIFRDSAIHDRLQTLGSQLSLGASSPQDAYSNLLQRYLVFTREIIPTDSRWREAAEKNSAKPCHNRFKCDGHAGDLPSGLLSCDDLRPSSLMLNELDLRNCSCLSPACALANTHHKQICVALNACGSRFLHQDESSECRTCTHHNSKLDTHHPPKVCTNGHPSPQLGPHHHHDNSTLHGKCTTDTCCHGNRGDSVGPRGCGKGMGDTSSPQPGTCTSDLNGVLDSGSTNSTRKGSMDDSSLGSGSTSEDGRAGNGKYCDCCYCEFFGHAAPPVAPTSHNYTEMRDKLRQKLTKKTPRAEGGKTSRSAAPAVDHRSVDDLLSFINGPCGDRLNGEADSNSKKRSRQRQKKTSVQDKQQGQTPPAKIEPGDDKSKESENKRKNQYNNKQRSGDKTSERQSCDQKFSGKTNVCPAPQETQEPKRTKKELEKAESCSNARTVPAAGPKGPQKADSCSNARTAPAAVQKGPQKADSSSNGRTAPAAGPKGPQKADSCSNARTAPEAAQKGPQKADSSSNGRTAPAAGHRAPQKADSYSNARTALAAGQKAPQKADSSSNASTASVAGQKKSKGRKKNKASLDDVFLPRNDFEHGDAIHDEAERELEEFKRFCMTPVERRERIPVNMNIKTLTKRACFS